MTKQSTSSLSARLLLEGGELALTAAASSARDLLLSRALCRFRAFRAAPGLTGGQLTRAARLYAEANAPFADSGMLLLRAPYGASIWYWDRVKLGNSATLKRISPETVWQAPGDGWRIVTCAEGYEAQYWEAGCLLASTWRREPLTPQQWAAFTLSVDAYNTDPPTNPPTPETPALRGVSWRRRVIHPPLGWRDVQNAAVTVTICAAAVAALLSGQALRHAQSARAEQARIEIAEQQLRHDPDLVRARQQITLLQDYARSTPTPVALSAAVETLETLSSFGLQASSWRVEAGAMSAIVDASISEAPVREIVAALEAKPHLCGAAPEIAGEGRFEVRARVVQDGGACDETARRRRR